MAAGRIEKPGAGLGDTVIGCDECGEQETYTTDGSVPHDEFVKWALEDFDSTHICGASQYDEEDTDEEE